MIEKVEEEEDAIPDINQHPMILGEINLCDLARSLSEKKKSVRQVIKKLKINELLDIVDHIQDQELQDLDFTGKQKDVSFFVTLFISM